jgi:nucleoside-diphosphate-sugar epimerase
MNILLTGGSGFIGSSFREYFKQYDQFKIFAPSHGRLDLTCLRSIQDYIYTHKIDHVIHAACRHTRWYARDTVENIYTNLLIMENLLVAARSCGKLVNFGSGAEFDISKDISLKPESAIDDIVPLEYGGFQKRIITKRLLATTNPECFNLRFFGGFGPLELEDRFIKSNLLNIMHNKPIVIHKNRWFSTYN